jgi:outer membrane protein assembly factor BamD
VTVLYKCPRLLPVANLIFISILAVSLSGCFGGKEDLYKDLSAQQIYQRGKKAAADGNNSQAIKDFDALEARYPYGDYTDKGQLALIAAYLKSDENASASATADRFIRMHPRYPHVDFAYYAKGVANFNDNFTFAFRTLPLDRAKRTSTYAQQSFDDFKTFIEKFPSSKYAPDARKRMIYLREQLADHELYIAKYYQGQGADLAAANRAGYIVNQFSRTEAAPKALLIMQESYTRIGMKKEAAEAMWMLEQNFPDYHKTH